MKILSIENTILPDHLKKDFNVFCNELITSAGDNLTSIVVYGGLAREEFDENWSDLNLILILKQLNIPELDKINPLLQRGEQQLLLEPFILSIEDIKPSASLFPIKFLDIRNNHLRIWGEDYLSTLQIPNDHILRNCQRELRNLILRMNYFYIQNYGFEEKLKFKLLKAYSTIIVHLRILLWLEKGVILQHKPQIIKEGINHYSLDGRLFREVQELRTGAKKYTNSELKRIYSDFLELVRIIANQAENLK